MYRAYDAFIVSSYKNIIKTACPSKSGKNASGIYIFLLCCDKRFPYILACIFYGHVQMNFRDINKIKKYCLCFCYMIK